VEQLITREVMTLDRWIAERWAPEHGSTLAQATRDRYASSYKLHIYPWLGDEALTDLGVARLRQWQAQRLAAGASPETIIKARVMLSSVLTHAAGSDAIPANKLLQVKAPPAPHRDATTPLSPLMIERLRRAVASPMTVRIPEGQRMGGDGLSTRCLISAQRSHGAVTH
jgi:hypothetical protein